MYFMLRLLLALSVVADAVRVNTDTVQVEGDSHSEMETVAIHEEFKGTLAQNATEKWSWPWNWNLWGGEEEEEEDSNLTCSLYTSPDGIDPSKGRPYSQKKSISYSENGKCRCDDESELYGTGCSRNVIGKRKFGEQVNDMLYFFGANGKIKRNGDPCYCKHIPLDCLAIKDWKGRGTLSCIERRGFLEHNVRRQFESIGPCTDPEAKDRNGNYKCARKDGYNGGIDGTSMPKVKIWLNKGEMRYINVFVKANCLPNATSCVDQDYRKVYPKDDPDRSGSGGRIYGHDTGGRNEAKKDWFWR